MRVFLAMRLLFSAEDVDIISFVRIAYYMRQLFIPYNYTHKVYRNNDMFIKNYINGIC